MADQLPTIRGTRAINAAETESTSLLGRGLATIQSGKLTESTNFNEEKLLSLLCKIMDLASRLGYLTFKENARYVLDQMCERISDTDIDKITIAHLQDCYIGMNKGTTSKKEVVNIKSIEELYLDDELSLSMILDNQIKKGMTKQQLLEVLQYIKRKHSQATQKPNSQPTSENKNNETSKPPKSI
ncbi:MAG: hypothetical protein ACXW1W_11590 [Methylococcaceae bacterium]